MSLREMLKKYPARLEEREEQQKKDKEYFHCLSEKLQDLGCESEELQTKLDSICPKGSFLDIEELNSPKAESIEDILRESPPRLRHTPILKAQAPLLSKPEASLLHPRINGSPTI
ncbi:hypothetical protein BGX34_008330, partial [Mortierella sp. NVP85]